MRVQTAIAYANASCVDGKPQLSGTSQVAGLTVLGQELPVNQAVEQALTLDTGAVDPSNADLSKVVVIQATPGITLSLAPVAAALKTALDALPTISLPPNIGQVKITPGAQVRTADTLTQQALRVQVSLLGQNVADLLVGEAKVGSAGVDCAAPSSPSTSSSCSARSAGSSSPTSCAAASGCASSAWPTASSSAGASRIRFTATGRRVASAVVTKSGSFRTTAAAAAPAPAQHQPRPLSGRARPGEVAAPQAHPAHGRARGCAARAARSRSAAASRDRSASPRAGSASSRRVSCKRGIVLRRIMPRRDGTFRVTVSAPPKMQAAVYRLGTQVRKNTRNPKLFPTFTLPRAVEIR